MNDELRKQIHNSLRRNGLIKIWREQLHETEEVTCNSSPTNNNDIATASDGTQYIKSLVIKYLNEKGYPLTQDNIDLAAKMFHANGGTYTRNNYKIVEHDEFENIPDEDTDIFLYSKILEQLTQLKQAVTNQTLMNYEVEVINDNQTGGTDMAKLADILNKRSQTGWKLVNTFTNELGVNSHVEQHTFSNNVRVNSTVDQIVMIFERPISMTDEKAQQIIQKLQNNS